MPEKKQEEPKRPKTPPSPHPNPQPQLAPQEKAKAREEIVDDLKDLNRQRQDLLDEMLENVDKYKDYTDFEAPRGHLDVLKRTICKTLTTPEFYYYLQVCHQLKLDPYLKQVWCYKDSKNNLVIIVGRDGYYAHCEKQKDFRGVSSAVIYDTDDFVPDYVNNCPLKHVAGDFAKRGNIIGAWALCKREGFDDRFVTVYFNEYKKTNNERSPWLTNPSAMIMKVAELEAMRKQFPVSGLQNEHDWDIIGDGKVKPHDKSKKVDDLMQESLVVAQKELIDLLDTTTHPQVEMIRKDIIADRKANRLDLEAIDHYKEILGLDKTEEE
jgi:phage recombination protein Bet